MSLQRLRQSSAVRAVFAQRVTAHGDLLSVHVRRRDREDVRATVVAGKKVGRAVERNRAKRRLRAALRAVPPPPGVDLVLVAKAPVLRADFEDVTDQVRALTRRAVARDEGDRGARVRA